MPIRLSEVGVKEEKLPVIAEKATLLGSVKKLDSKDVLCILNDAY